MPDLRPARAASRAAVTAALAALTGWLVATTAGCVPAALSPAGKAGPGLADFDPASSAAWAAYQQHRDAVEGEDADTYRPWVAVLPFEDDSGFRPGVWDLVHDMPRLLASEMERSTAWRVVPFEVVAEVVGRSRAPWSEDDLARIGRLLRADVLISAVLLDYNMERLHVGDPLIGGYKSYKGVTELEATLVRVADLSRVGSAHSQQETIDRGLGFDLLGKPREQDQQFANLGAMEFGSDEFRGTAIGQATVMAMDQVVQEAARLVRPQGIQVASGAPEILSVFGAEIFINVGSENGVHRGYRFAVYPAAGRADTDPDQRIAVIEVRDIIGARVSRVSALFGAPSIRVGDRLELLVAEPEPSWVE